MRFVHAADLHIDSPLTGLERYQGAPYERLRAATRDAFRKVVDVCLEEEARFLVLAGDVFDGDWKDVGTGLFFTSQLARLRDARCRVLLLRGNHDFALTNKLTYPDHVHEFGTRGGRGKPVTYRFDDEGVAFHGASYADKKVETSLLPYPAAIPGLLNVGVLHTNASGSRDHANYAPCTVEELAAHAGYAYWALGHVHGHAILRRDPWVVYPGNTQGRSVRELGPKGCVVVEASGEAIDSVRFVETSVLRWARVEVALEPDDERDDLLEKTRRKLDEAAGAAGGRPLAARVVVRGAARAHAEIVARHAVVVADVRALAVERGDDTWIEKVELQTSPHVPLDELRDAQGLVGDLLRETARLRATAGEVDLVEMGRVLAPLEKKLARELEEMGLLPSADVDWLASALEEAEALLAQRLTASSGGGGGGGGGAGGSGGEGP